MDTRLEIWPVTGKYLQNMSEINNEYNFGNYCIKNNLLHMGSHLVLSIEFSISLHLSVEIKGVIVES